MTSSVTAWSHMAFPKPGDDSRPRPRADVLAALADEEHAAPSRRGGRHGHQLTARNSGVLVRASQLQAEAPPIHVGQPQNGVSNNGRMNVRFRRQRNGRHCAHLGDDAVGTRLELVVREVIVDGIRRQSGQRLGVPGFARLVFAAGELRLHDVGRCLGACRRQGRFGISRHHPAAERRC
jgi:hypothetical protein